MLINLVQTQGMTFFILFLYFLQKKGHLEKEEGKILFSWLGNLVIANCLMMHVFSFESNPFSLLMLASFNGLATIAFLFLQKITIQKICPKSL